LSQRLISQLAHVELLTPKPDDSLRFMRDVMGLYESDRVGQSVYLRGWGDFFHHSVVLTEADQPGLGHAAWRAGGREELEVAVQRLKATGLGEGWHDGGPGHGPAYRYRGAGGHVHEIFWEVERWSAPPELKSPFPNRPQRFEPRGVAARHLDHVTVMTKDVMSDVAWYRDTLGFRFMEWTVLDEHSDIVVFAMLTNNEKGHDLGLLADMSAVPGRLHHVAFWVDTPDELSRAADVLLNAGATIEFGPGRHGMGEQEYLYFREPGGARLELNTGGYRNYQPDWEPVKWTPAQGSNTFYRNVAMPDSMLEAFPPAAAAAQHDDASVVNPWAATSVS
jgi:catechol 2,3-dioxygenase